MRFLSAQDALDIYLVELLQAERDAEKDRQQLQGSIQDELQSGRAGMDAATQALSRITTAHASQKQDSQRASQTFASLKV